MTNYTHFCGPRKGILNVETDVPTQSRAERERCCLSNSETITQQEAILLCSYRQTQQLHFNQTPHKGAVEGFSI